MILTNNYVLIERIEEKQDEGDFATVNVQDSFIYKGKVLLLPEQTVYVGNAFLQDGFTILFKKGSPDTFDYGKHKLVSTNDILAIL